MPSPQFIRDFKTKAHHAGFVPTVRRALWLLKQRAYLKAKGSYSQYGEDLELYKRLNNQRDGFYVDVGAYDPIRLSNTYFFYRKGWRGLTIEPDPSVAALFRQTRPEDTHLSIGLGPENRSIPFFVFESKTRSTFCEEEAHRYLEQGFTPNETIDCPVKTMASVLDEHLGDRQWDFLSLDTEGYELPILSGNDWERFRPRFICIEGYENDARRLAGAAGERKDLREFLEDRSYQKRYDNLTNCIYEDTQAL